MARNHWWRVRPKAPKEHHIPKIIVKDGIDRLPTQPSGTYRIPKNIGGNYSGQPMPNMPEHRIKWDRYPKESEHIR